jgi:hypothetical protein
MQKTRVVGKPIFHALIALGQSVDDFEPSNKASPASRKHISQGWYIRIVVSQILEESYNLNCRLAKRFVCSGVPRHGEKLWEKCQAAL